MEKQIAVVLNYIIWHTMAIRSDRLAVERKWDLAAYGSGQIWRQRVSDQMGFCKIPVLIIQLTLFGAKGEPGSSQCHPHVAFYKAKSISACSLGRSPTYVTVSWMSSHSLGKNDLIITAQPSRQRLSTKATVLATEMMLGIFLLRSHYCHSKEIQC